MRVLLVTPFVPDARVGHGTATVAAHVADHFRRRHRLTVACFTFSPAEAKLAAALRDDGLDIHAVEFPRSRRRAWRARLASVARGLPYTIALFDVPEMRQLLRQLFAEHRFDLVQFDTTFVGAYVDEVPPAARTVLVEIDFTVKPLQRRYELERSVIRRGWYWREWQQMRRYEPALCRQFDRVIAVAVEDRAELKRLDPGLRVDVLRYGVTPRLFDVPLKERNDRSLLFVGAFLHQPNVDAMAWFLADILPLVRAQMPDVQVTCVGADPPDWLRRRAEQQGVTVTGWVSDVADYLARADVGIVPLRAGGGVKLKTLEMMAAGRAMVTTPVGVEGIAAIDGEHVLLAGSGERFAAQVTRLLGDDQLRLRLARGARELALRDHQWTANLRRLDENYAELVYGTSRLAARAV